MLISILIVVGMIVSIYSCYTSYQAHKAASVLAMRYLISGEDRLELQYTEISTLQLILSIVFFVGTFCLILSLIKINFFG